MSPCQLKGTETHPRGSSPKAWREWGNEEAPVHPMLLVPVDNNHHLKTFKEVEKQITSLPAAVRS